MRFWRVAASSAASRCWSRVVESSVGGAGEGAEGAAEVVVSGRGSVSVVRAAERVTRVVGSATGAGSGLGCGGGGSEISCSTGGVLSPAELLVTLPTGCSTGFSTVGV